MVYVKAFLKLIAALLFYAILLAVAGFFLYLLFKYPGYVIVSLLALGFLIVNAYMDFHERPWGCNK